MTDDDLDRHIRAIRARENGWSDDPDDSGGPTHDGITLETWLAYHAIPKRVLLDNDACRVWIAALKNASDHDLMGCYRWYFRTQGIDELIDEFDVPDELVPLVMDMRTLHSLEGCREILGRAREIACRPFFAVLVDELEVFITFARMAYMLQVAEERPKDRKYVRGWMHRALKAIGLWPPKPETKEV